MKILILSSDNENNTQDITNVIQNFPEKERGIIIVGCGLDVGHIIAHQIAHVFQEKLIIVGQESENNGLGGLGSLRDLDDKISKTIQLELQKIGDDMIAYTDSKAIEISLKKQQEKLRRRHYKSPKQSTKKK